MSKDDYHSRIPMRGFSSRIPLAGSQSSTPSSHPQFTQSATPVLVSKLTTTKLARPTDIPLSSLVRPAMKHPQVTKSSLSNVTSRAVTRRLSASNDHKQNTLSSQNKLRNHDDQMLIDETIDLVGSDDNVHRYASKESIQSPPHEHESVLNSSNITFDMCRRDVTFIKSPTHVPSTIGSVNSLPDTKEAKANCVKRSVSKSRDSLVQIGSQTRIVQLRKSDNLLGSSLSLTKSPDWGSQDMLDTSHMDPLSSAMTTNDELREPSQFCLTNNGAVKISTKGLCPSSQSNEYIDNILHPMDVDEYSAAGANPIAMHMRRNENVVHADPQKRYSFGLDITECTLDCSIELCDTSMSSALHKVSPIDKQNSFDVDESLGILTPDQMKEFLDSTNTNNTNNNFDLPIVSGHRLNHQCRIIDQTPSPEELPLDPVDVKMEEIAQQMSHQAQEVNHESSQVESDPKTDMTKSATSKVSTSIITSVTSITSLDTGYIGDGEMSRPASRGASGDQSPSKEQNNHEPHNWNQAPPVQQGAAIHRQRLDAMTDSDFFTESDADDVFQQRENQRRAQVIDGQLYGPMLQGANVVFQQQRPLENDSCMESSGVFTDVENRGCDDLLKNLNGNQAGGHDHVNDMSPDLSSDTITSGTACSQNPATTPRQSATSPSSTQHQENEEIAEELSLMPSDALKINGDVNFVAQSAISDKIHDLKEATESVNGKKPNGINHKTCKNERNIGLKKYEPASRNKVTKMDDKSTKRCLNGKWESVMNKITENKSSKKNFDNVKSKVTCGGVKRNITTGCLKTSLAKDTDIESKKSSGYVSKRNTITKDSTLSTVKRGRLSSKGSQRNSQSDLSNNGTTADSKNFIGRSAKKRDVRTINSSPSDLGSKTSTITSTTVQRGNTRNNTISQKRASLQQQNTIASNKQIEQLKASPPGKKLIQKRAVYGNSLKQDQNQLSHQPNQQNKLSPCANNSSKANTHQPKNKNEVMIDTLNVSPKFKIKELENISSSKIMSNNVNKISQPEKLLQIILDQQIKENQKQGVELARVNKGVEALGVLVYYLAHHLDAFACPSLKKSQQKTAKQLLEARDQIDEMKSAYHSLEDMLREREKYFNKRELESQELHQCEMIKAKSLIEKLENENMFQMKTIEANDARNQEKIEKLTLDAEEKLRIRDKSLQTAKDREMDLLKRIHQLEITENELREKVHSSELEFSAKLHSSMIKERELTEKINQMTKLLDEFKMKADLEKQDLEEKLNLSQDELSVIRNSKNFCGSEPFQNKTINSCLQDEVTSLRCVLELKQSEISELRKTNCELQRIAEDATSVQFKCSALESRVEDLNVQLHAKQEEEKELLNKLKTLQEQYDNVSQKTSRLSLHNEELLWRLKQNAEKYSMTLNELSKSYHESSFRTNDVNLSDFRSGNGSALDCVDIDSSESPPASPIIKGVVEKNDSVSWVLEMDDEMTPEVLATRFVRRAGSFRSDKCSPSPVLKRQKCQNNVSIQQSASASSILKHYSESSPTKTINGRLRSKSVSATKVIEPNSKTSPQITRSISNSGSTAPIEKNVTDKSCWKQQSDSAQMQISSPKKILQEETVGIDEAFSTSSSHGIKNNFLLNETTVESFHRDTAPKFKKSRENRGLITCDTSTLTGNETKKQFRPKASAGETKFSVSGSNSEDEVEEEANSLSNVSSNASTSPSTPSISSGSVSSSNISNKQPIESIENALLLWSEHNDTSIEVSWCEGTVGPSESCV